MSSFCSYNHSSSQQQQQQQQQQSRRQCRRAPVGEWFVAVHSLILCAVGIGAISTTAIYLADHAKVTQIIGSSRTTYNPTTRYLLAVAIVSTVLAVFLAVTHIIRAVQLGHQQAIRKHHQQLVESGWGDGSASASMAPLRPNGHQSNSIHGGGPDSESTAAKLRRLREELRLACKKTSLPSMILSVGTSPYARLYFVTLVTVMTCFSASFIHFSSRMKLPSTPSTQKPPNSPSTSTLREVNVRRTAMRWSGKTKPGGGGGLAIDLKAIQALMEQLRLERDIASAVCVANAAGWCLLLSVSLYLLLVKWHQKRQRVREDLEEQIALLEAQAAEPVNSNNSNSNNSNNSGNGNNNGSRGRQMNNGSNGSIGEKSEDIHLFRSGVSSDPMSGLSVAPIPTSFDNVQVLNNSQVPRIVLNQRSHLQLPQQQHNNSTGDSRVMSNDTQSAPTAINTSDAHSQQQLVQKQPQQQQQQQQVMLSSAQHSIPQTLSILPLSGAPQLSPNNPGYLVLQMSNSTQGSGGTTAIPYLTPAFPTHIHNIPVIQPQFLHQQQQQQQHPLVQYQYRSNIANYDVSRVSTELELPSSIPILNHMRPIPAAAFVAGGMDQISQLTQGLPPAAADPSDIGDDEDLFEGAESMISMDRLKFESSQFDEDKPQIQQQQPSPPDDQPLSDKQSAVDSSPSLAH